MPDAARKTLLLVYHSWTGATEQMVHAGEAADKYKAITMIWESRPDLYEKHIAEISR